MDRVILPLSLMGAKFSGSKAPFVITGSKLKGISYTLPVASAQVKSAIILAGLYAEGATTIEEPVPTRDHTELMLKASGADLERRGIAITVRPAQKLSPLRVHVPGDISSAAYFIVAAIITPGSEATVKNVGINPTRTGILDALKDMGANIKIANMREEAGEAIADITASYSALEAVEISGAAIPRMIDEIPVLAVAALAAKGKTIIRDAQELKVKESNRINAMAAELSKLGAKIEERPDGLEISGKNPLTGSAVDSRGDHRVAMSLAVASLIAKGETSISGCECVDISYPGFFEAFDMLKKR
jgi:3-phosphoshikimate 1-carboxyvinyltransferase